MSSTTNDVTMASPVIAHIEQTIDILDAYALGVDDISSCMYEIFENQCDFYGTNKDGDKFLLYRANVTDLTEDTDLYTPITENIEATQKARQASHTSQMLFREFRKSLSGSGSSAVIPNFSLEHGMSAKGGASWQSVLLVGNLNVKGVKYKITFGQAVDFEHMKSCGAMMLNAIHTAKDWSKEITNDNLQDKLSSVTDGVKIIRTDGQEPVLASDDDDDDDLEAMYGQSKDDTVDADLLLAMKLQAEEDKQNRSVFNVFQQRKPLFNPNFSSSSYASQSSASLLELSPAKQKVPMIKIAEVKDEAVVNLREAMELLEGIVMSTNPYKDRTSEQVYRGIRVELVPQNLGKDNISERDNAKNWSFKISFDKCYWMIPVINEENELKSSDEILDSLKEIAYFGPEINDLLIHWVKRGVFLSTEFSMDTEAGKDGKESTKRVCTMGMFKVDNLTCCPLADLSAMHEGNFKKRIEIPEDIYQLKPDQLIAGIQQNIHDFIDHMLEATGCKQPEAAKKNDVQTMVESLHSKVLKEKLEALGAELYWTFLTPKGVPNSLKLYIDIEEEAKRPEVYAVLREFMNDVDHNKSWSFTITSEAINTVREWGKGDSMVKDPVAPLCVQMSWKDNSSESINNILKFIDEFEPSNLRKFGLTTRAVVADERSESVMVELHALSAVKLPGAKKEMKALLTAACAKFTSKKPEETMIVQQLDSSVQTRTGYKMLRPNTLSFAMRSVTGPMGKMVNFLREWSGVRDLNISVQEKFGGSKSLVLEYEGKDAKEKEQVTEKLDTALNKAVLVLNDNVWIYDAVKTPDSQVKFSVELFGGQGTGSGFSSGFGAFSSSIFGGFSSGFGARSRVSTYVKPKPAQFDPGYGDKVITGTTLNEIFNITDDEL